MESIDIQTTQNVTIEYELASLQDRFVAMLIDVAIIISLVVVIIYLAAWVVGGLFGEDGSLMMIMQFIPIVTFLGYHLVSEIIMNGQSWGKRAMNLKVVRLDGAEVGLSDYLLRAVFHIIDTLFSAGVVATLVISASQRKQRLGDMTANTTVIKLKSNNQKGLNDVLKIISRENHEPTYPAIKHFNEEDIILINKVINRYHQYPNQAHEAALASITKRFSELLELETVPNNKIEFLETLLKDYVVLSR